MAERMKPEDQIIYSRTKQTRSFREAVMGTKTAQQVMTEAEWVPERMEPEDPLMYSRTKKTRSFREALMGKITEPEAQQVMTEAEWEPGNAAGAVLSQGDKPALQGLTLEEVLRDLNSKFDGKTEKRLFACAPDDFTWWHKVPSRKPVCKCRKCRTRYDAIPVDQEWGVCRYVCVCGNEFTGFGSKGVESPCHRCGGHCYPAEVFKTNKRRKPRTRNNRNKHSCAGTNCCNRSRGNNRGECPHPKSRAKRVLIPSTVHISTGSTVATFLSQGSLEEFETDLSDIGEED